MLTKHVKLVQTVATMRVNRRGRVNTLLRCTVVGKPQLQLTAPINKDFNYLKQLMSVKIGLKSIKSDRERLNRS